MDKIRFIIFAGFIPFLAPLLGLALSEDSCEEVLKNVLEIPTNNYYSVWNPLPTILFQTTAIYWFNMTFWGGHMQVSEKDTVVQNYLTSRGNILVITEKHPALSDITDNIVEANLCSLNENGICITMSRTILRMLICNGSLLYSLRSVNHLNADLLQLFICFDRIYTGLPCTDVITLQPKESLYDDVMTFPVDGQTGWTEAFVDGRQFVMPTLEEIEIVFEKCSLDISGHYFLQDTLPDGIGEDPVRLVVCYAYRYRNSYSVSRNNNGKCEYFIYVRACNGILQFDLTVTYNRKEICLIHHNKIKVNPEIVHEENTVVEDGREVTINIPFLQFRCSFDVKDDIQYIAKWYVDGTFQIQTGPSIKLDDLVFRENFFLNLTDVYKVQCGIFTAFDNEPVEELSGIFYAGWKIQNKDISLSKSGVATVTVEQTVPIGCSYRTDFTAKCLETVSLEDIVPKADICDGIIVTNSKDPSKSFLEIKSLKKGEKWEKKTYSLHISTIDNNYDDKTIFDLQLTLTYNSNDNIGRPITSKVVGTIEVKILDIDRHWSKRCYSHMDPHMRTVDGINYEAQREGDYMMLINEKYQTEIQTSARYCSPGYTRGPVCACGIAIAVGADTFIINRCHESSFKFDPTCDDGGIIDIERIHDYRYLVRTPIGTFIEIFIWGDVMNIDVYMSAKDFGNVVGLCGNFDEDKSNDFEHRDGTFSNDNNRSYKFADSWRLTDEENLFLNQNRKLDHWDNAGYINSSCGRPKSITRTKCKIKGRKRRSYPERQEVILKKRNQSFLSRQRRSDTIFTEDEAFQLCNSSIYTTPAVQDFPDKLAEEDPDIVVEHCVYDLIQGNDTTWIDAHVSALNNAADTVLMLNPVYVANNTDKVNSFRAKTCLNNCSGNGDCADTGLCECSGSYRGPDCSIDIRIPPIVYEIEGDGVCTITEDDDCTCFQIRTDNIFDGFVCSVTENKVYFNGTRVEGNTLTELGHYEDIFTGECCVSTRINKRSSINVEDTGDISVVMYDFSVSNDGVNYGETNAVYLFDTTCLQLVDMNETVIFKLKDEYCFIDGICVAQNFKVMDSSACSICDPETDLYNLTKVKCKDSSTTLGTGEIVGIVLGSATFIIVAAVLIYFLVTKTHTKQSSSIGIQPQSNLAQNNDTTNKEGSMSNLTDFSPGKPRFEQNLRICKTQTNLIAGMDKDVPAREYDVRRTQADKYVNQYSRDSTDITEKGKPKRDLSFINVELN